MRVLLREGKLALDIPYDAINVSKCKSIPQRRWDAKSRLWIFNPVEKNIVYVKKIFPNIRWEPDAQAAVDGIFAQKEYRDKVARGEVNADAPLDDIPFRLPPMGHQRKALVLGRDQDVFAYLMEQGTGKTKVLLDDAAHNFRLGRIDAVLVLCPNSVKSNWVNNDTNPTEMDQVDRHMAPDIPYAKFCWDSSMNRAEEMRWEKFYATVSDPGTLKILVANIEGISSARSYKIIDNFLQKTSAMIVVDESTRIKNRTAKRTKNAKQLRALCNKARILSGTPLVKCPLDAYSQFGFLDPNIIGFASYAGFQAHYAVRGQENNGRAVMYYQNLEELSERVAGVCFRITKKDCLDLPDKIYTKRYIQMTAAQAQHYKDMRDNMITYLDGLHSVEATVVVSQMIRLQQITAGHLPILDPVTREQTGIHRINKVSPKVEEALDIIDECSGKVIVWCRFKFEIKEMSEQLTARGIRHVLFYGEISEKGRIEARSSFQNDPEVRVFVGQVNTGGIGIDLYAATTVIYLSNTFSTEDRVQSEDRAHRIGQRFNVEYIDLLVKGTIDIKTMAVLRENVRLSDLIMRDGWREWI